MQDRIEGRLADLRAEYETGQRALADLEQKGQALRDTMLRIRGAIQVLEEFRDQEAPGPPAPAPAPAHQRA